MPNPLWELEVALVADPHLRYACSPASGAPTQTVQSTGKGKHREEETWAGRHWITMAINLFVHTGVLKESSVPLSSNGESGKEFTTWSGCSVL